ncbi:MAG: bifunctional glutamate N-acetyltransferase/amino-acid acetyltransferase ArgJ [Alphaproteobacteria bacterium]|nr:bifunctional glutamate N-acetyltransferase/amino-acid acetyltransferase ArgJ [Alphaproteobacteria bacterium]
MPKISPLAPSRQPHLAPVAGVRLAATASGLRYKGRKDLALFVLEPGSTVAGVFTRSKTAGAPVDWCKAALSRGSARAIVVNSGNANAFNGATGMSAVRRTVSLAAEIIGCDEDEVFIASTGVIGEPLPVEKIEAALANLHGQVSADAWQSVAEAILTTDTFPKVASAATEIDSVPVTLNAIAKGSGMIAPDMATMLAFIFTDAAIEGPALQKMLEAANDRSFNAITVDSDTSTSDTALLCATGQAGNAPVSASGDRRLAGFKRALDTVMIDLAHQIVRDGEGASKFISVTVSGAASKRAARRIAMAIANSPLVKTAIAGEDANWGRIVMAVGKAGEKADRDRIAITIGDHPVAQMGARVEGYDEGPIASHMKGQEIDIAVDVGVGRGKAQVWTCDLTHGYISINADYRS